MTSACTNTRSYLLARRAGRTGWLRVRALQLAVLLAVAAASLSAGAQTRDPVIMEVAAADICLSVEKLRPVEPATRFHASPGKLYCLSRIGGIEKPTRIQHVWYMGGEERLRISLPVNPPSWRTYSWKRISGQDVGQWRVEISDAAGNVMKTVLFDITSPPP